MATELEDLPPSVFVASSSASLPLARRLAERLRPDIAADVWDTQFKPGDNTLDSLLLFSSLYEFGIFVLSADDLTTTKDKPRYEPRDNVIFELGAFMGAVGRSRAFAVVVDSGDDKDVKLPTDLAGNTYVKVRLKSPSDTKQAVAVIRNQVLDLAKTAPLSLLPGTSLAQGYFKNFILPVGRLLRTCPVLKTSGARVDLARRGYELTVLIPQILSKAGGEDRDNYVAARALKSASVPPAARKTQRTYDFFVDDTAGDGPAQLYDYPTTIRAAYDAIGLVLPQRALGDRQAQQDALAAREVRTFGRALTYLLGGSEAQVFPNPVKIAYI